MMKWLYPLAVLLLAAGCSAPSKPVTTASASQTQLRYDGLYRSAVMRQGEDTVYRYLRFYPDGEVIAVSSDGEPEGLNLWFTRDHEGVGHGRFEIKGKRVFFTDTFWQGTVDYVGEVHKASIHFDTVNRKSGHRASYDFEFIRQADSAAR